MFGSSNPETSVYQARQRPAGAPPDPAEKVETNQEDVTRQAEEQAAADTKGKQAAGEEEKEGEAIDNEKKEEAAEDDEEEGDGADEKAEEVSDFEEMEVDKPTDAQGPSKCAIEIRRELNIAENRRKMIELGLIEEKKPKRAAKKKEPAAPAAPTRQSTRKRAAVKYNDDADWEEVPSVKRRRGKVAMENEEQVEAPPPKRVLRTLPSTDYARLDPNLDSAIWCNGCSDFAVPPCAYHGDTGMKFMSPDQLRLDVCTSRVPKGGQGLLYRGDHTIEAGTMIGPYTGTFIPFDEYKVLEQQRRESGNAWVLYDSETMEKAIGYVDPGASYDPNLHQLAKANHPAEKGGENLAGTQFDGGIYYRALRQITVDEEVLVNYGKDYATELGINFNTYATYGGAEDHRELPAPCPSCGISFSDENYLEEHLYPASGALSRCKGKVLERMVGRPYPCHLCPKAYHCPGELQQHVDSFHNKLKKFACGQCDKTFSTYTGCTGHVQATHGAVRIPCEAEDCGKTFSDKCHMRRHYRAAHLEERPYKCPTCGLAYQSNQVLNQHVDTVHLHKKPFRCTTGDCDKTFGEKSALTKHIKGVHLKVKSHACPYPGCGAAFLVACQLVVHERSHTGEKPFRCPYFDCSYTAVSQKSVNVHVKTSPLHIKDRFASDLVDQIMLKFLCPEDGCTKRFATQVEVDRHFVKLHPKF